MALSTKLDQLFRETVFPSNAARQIQPITQVLLDQRECIIRYPAPDTDYLIADVLEWFETYADAANKRPQKWIDRPFISPTERLPGKWRLVTVRTAAQRGEDPGIYLVLREGWATSLVESEARFGSIEAGVQNGTVRVTRLWHNIDNTKIDTLVTSTKATKTVTNPKIEGTAKTGTFTVIQVSGEKAEDGSGVISQTFLTRRGEGVVLSYMENCDTKVDVTFHHDLTETAVEALDNTYSTATTGVEVNIQPRLDPQTGLYDVVVTTRTRQYRPHSARYSVYSNDAYTQTDERLGVYADTYIPSIYGAKQGQLYRQQVQIKDDCTKDVTTDFTTSRTDAIYFGSRRTQFSHTDEAVYANWRTLIAAPTPDSGVYDATNQLQPDGTYNARLVYKIGVNSSSAEFASRRENAENVDEALYRGRNSQIDAPSSGVRGLYEARNNLREDGLYDATLIYRATVSKEADFSSERTPFRVSTSHLYENRDGVVSAPEVESGLYRAENRMNPDGTYTSSLVYRTGATEAEAKFAATRSGTDSADEALYKSRTSQIGAPSSGQGGVYAANNNLGDDGLYDATLVYKASVAASVCGVSRRTPFKLTNATLYENSRSELTAPTSDSGVYSASQRINADLTYSGSLTYEVGTNSGEVEFLAADSADGISREILYKSRTSPVGAIADGTGYVYEARNSLGDDGLYDASLIYNASKPVVLDVKTQNTWTKDEHSLIYNNSATAPAAGITGQRGIYRVSGLRHNRDGTYDGSLIYGTSEARSFETSFTDERATVYIYRYENKSDLTFPAVSPYSRNSVSGISWNPDQTYTFSVVSKSLVGTGGVQQWNDSDAQVYLKKAGDTGKYYYFSKIFTHNKSEAENFMSGTGSSTYGTKVAGSTIVGYYDSHVTNYSWQGATRFISTRVDLME